MATKTDLLEFQGDYEVKNGYIGDETVLNAAPDRLKIELNALWAAVVGSNLTIDELNVNDGNTTFYDAGEFGNTTTV